LAPRARAGFLVGILVDGCDHLGLDDDCYGVDGMTIAAVYDFESIRQYHDELVERKQAAVVATAKPAESTFGWPVVGQQVLPPPPQPKPIESVYGWKRGDW
jgi:hypothetical protein